MAKTSNEGSPLVITEDGYYALKAFNNGTAGNVRIALRLNGIDLYQILGVSGGYACVMSPFYFFKAGTYNYTGQATYKVLLCKIINA